MWRCFLGAIFSFVTVAVFSTIQRARVDNGRRQKMGRHEKAAHVCGFLHAYGGVSDAVFSGDPSVSGAEGDISCEFSGPPAEEITP